MLGRVSRIAFAAALVWCVFVEAADFFLRAQFGMELDGDWFLLLSDNAAADCLRFVRTYLWQIASVFAATAAAVAAAAWLARRAFTRTFAAFTACALFVAVEARVTAVGSFAAWKPVYVVFDTLRSAREYGRIGRAGRWTDELAARVRPAPEGATNYVFVIGESLTSRRVPFYGYSKNTMPRLASLGGELAVEGPVRAPSAYTMRSLAALLVSDGFSAPVWFRLAGYRTAFVGAQPRWERYCSVAAAVFSACERKVYLSEVNNGARVYDEQVLPYAKEMMKGEGPFALFVHLIGSHFEPGTRVPEGVAADEGLDDYDRSVRYTDQVLASLIESLPPRTELFFISDHGESVDAANWRDVRSEALWMVPVFVYPAASAPRISSVADFVSAWRQRACR